MLSSKNKYVLLSFHLNKLPCLNQFLHFSTALPSQSAERTSEPVNLIKLKNLSQGRTQWFESTILSYCPKLVPSMTQEVEDRQN